MNISSARLRWLYIRGSIWWMGLGFTAFGIVLLILAYLLWQYERGFEANAVQTVAKVTHKGTSVVKGGKQGNTPKTLYGLDYTFQDGAGQQYTGNAGISAEAWDQVKIGDALTIEYDRTNPASVSAHNT